MKKKLDILSLSEKERDDYINKIIVPRRFKILTTPPRSHNGVLMELKCKLIELITDHHSGECIVVYANWNKCFREWQYYADTYEQVQQYIYWHRYNKASLELMKGPEIIDLIPFLQGKLVEET